jgi:chorismate mutase
MALRGIRGAVTSEEDHPDAIKAAVHSLLKAIMHSNPTLSPDDIASVFFTATRDLKSDFPAHSARELGWTTVPLLCGQEIAVDTGLSRCIRVLVHWNTELPQSEINHVYLGEAVALRPDLQKQD